jgi:hypothetical protein
MNIIQHSAARRVRAVLVTTAVAGASIAGLLGTGAAQASTASHRVATPVVIDGCIGVSGSITYSPGLRSTKIKAERAVLSGKTSGCNDIFSGPMSGTGKFNATLSGSASLAAENFKGRSPSTGRPPAGSTPPPAPSA